MRNGISIREVVHRISNNPDDIFVVLDKDGDRLMLYYVEKSGLQNGFYCFKTMDKPFSLHEFEVPLVWLHEALYKVDGKLLIYDTFLDAINDNAHIEVVNSHVISIDAEMSEESYMNLKEDLDGIKNR